jgi:hypothetical protein
MSQPQSLEKMPIDPARSLGGIPLGRDVTLRLGSFLCLAAHVSPMSRTRALLSRYPAGLLTTTMRFEPPTPQEEPGMFDFFRKFLWVLEPCRDDDQERLPANLEKSVVYPAEAKVLELRGLPGGTRDRA